MDESTPVFDYFPRGIPLVLDDAIEAAMHETLDEGNSAGEALEAMQDEQIRKVRNSPQFRERLRRAFDEAAVNLVATTMGGASLFSVNDPTTHPEVVRWDLARWQAHFDHLDWLHKIRSPEQARKVARNDNVGLILSLQNAAAFEGDLSTVDELHNLGVQIVQLTYNAQNLIGTGCTDRSGGGLSNYGQELVMRLNDLGIVVDISHCNTQTTFDAIETSRKPVAATHTFCEIISNHDRAKSEEELKAIADTNGYVGILTLPFFIAPGREECAYEIFLDHIDHAASIVGVDRVGIGTDWGTFGKETPDRLQSKIKKIYAEMGFDSNHGTDLIGNVFLDPMKHYSDWPAIPKGLHERGYTETEVQGILGENFLDFWERVKK